MAIPTIIDTPADVRAWSRGSRQSGRSIALVPTMGALHAGHRALIEVARSLADVVVVSIFVNPLQFGEPADFSEYPRPIDTDLITCAEAGVDIVYSPTAIAMYPAGFDTRVVPGTLGTVMEGRSRPGHFEGVATVVTKLLTAVDPDVAAFGEKDYQQLAIIRRLVTDLDLGVEIVGVPTVRDPDGLALSSRNRRLTTQQRQAATVIPRSIEEAKRLAHRPEASADEIVAAAEAIVAAEPTASLDYVRVFDADTLEAVNGALESNRVPKRYRVAIAARFGDVRLIDNADLFSS